MSVLNDSSLSISVSVFSLPLALWFWQAVAPWQWAAFVLCGVLGSATAPSRLNCSATAVIGPASRTFYVSPRVGNAFVLVAFTIVVLGGMGSQIGVVLAAVLLIGLPEWFRDLGNYRMLAFGLAMVLIMVFRPRGLIGLYSERALAGGVGRALRPRLVLYGALFVLCAGVLGASGSPTAVASGPATSSSDKAGSRARSRSWSHS